MLMTSTDVSKAQWDSDTLIFRYQSPAPLAMEWLSLAFSANNRLRFIDAPSHIPLKVVERLGKSKMECKCKEHRVEGCYEVKIQGMGWGQYSAEGVKIRGLVLDILDVFEEEGWTIYASVDQKVGGEGSGGGDTDTWHCCRPKGWVPGMPVYHN
ncbi:hypothetical protein BDV96DRAFT_589571 [Lophiotrema nucula]|uniref:Uncharacterized protein n=1 Tax=Lophiotrema nucula TaxID=690887 RepID=A0A6A5YK30_9PLEO|nr:hypothetical protein BDV96DRAFT_589571 [Lophiotrema nucula]